MREAAGIERAPAGLLVPSTLRGYRSVGKATSPARYEQVEQRSGRETRQSRRGMPSCHRVVSWRELWSVPETRIGFVFKDFPESSMAWFRKDSGNGNDQS